MNQNNLILATDSYKLNHWNQYPKDTEAVYSYLESREGAEFPYTVFFGLQSLLKKLEGVVISEVDILEAQTLVKAHFGNEDMFNLKGWYHILWEHGGKLPIRIKAVPEGSVIPTGNVLMTVENTDPACYWLTNAIESFLTHVWYPSTVATLSRSTKELINGFLERTADSTDGLPFMLHDFGYRGASSDESAAIGGAGHLVNFVGTDTLPAMLLAVNDYGASLATLAFSVPATEHSVMTSLGEEGESKIVDQLLDEYPTGILSVVADSYNIYEFVERLGSEYRDRILERDGVFVVRPDSTTQLHAYPSTLTAWILNRLWNDFGGTMNSKGFKVLDPHVRVLWGDGIDPHGISTILGQAQIEGFSAENLVFGMGGGLLQKVNRDTQRFAFKSSAQKRNGEWHDVFKSPLDASKASKKGRLALIRGHGLGFPQKEYLRDGYAYATIPEESAASKYDKLQIVFENGELVNPTTFDAVRKRAAI